MTLAAACTLPTLAPGADQVRITRNAPDVASCSAVGNLQTPKSDLSLGNGPYVERNLRNRTVGFGGNTALVTADTLGIPTEGIAYKCP
jgi:hypothetical protein